MNIRFWGVRGSIPAPGPETNRYGGNTSCVSVTADDGHLFVLDMGTGVINLGQALVGRELDVAGDFAAGDGEATVLLSHAHWDHIQGFPFFAPIFVPGNAFAVHGNAHSAERLEEILEGQMNPHFSPIYTVKNLGASIDFAPATDTSFTTHEVEVSSVSNPHGTTDALAFRLEQGGRSIVYASDAGYPEEGAPEASIQHYRGADVLVHDSTYTPDEQRSRRDRGLSSFADAAAVAVAAGVGRLVLFHYDQDHPDAMVDEIRERCQREVDRLGGGVEVLAAHEGLSIELG